MRGRQYHVAGAQVALVLRLTKASARVVLQSSRLPRLPVSNTQQRGSGAKTPLGHPLPGRCVALDVCVISPAVSPTGRRSVV